VITPALTYRYFAPSEFLKTGWDEPIDINRFLDVSQHHPWEL